VTIENIFEHAYISVIGSFLGILLGLAVSLAILNLSQRINQEGKRISQLAFFIPWRTLLVGLLLLNFYPVFLVVSFGLRSITGILSVSYVTFLLTIVIFFQSAHRKADKPIVQLIPWLRTLAVFSVILTTHYGSWASGGLGYYAYIKLNTFEYSAAWNAFWVICGIAFLIDEVIGLVQWFVDSRSSDVLP